MKPKDKMTEDHKAILKKAIEQWGRHITIDMIFEECAHLIYELQKLKFTQGEQAAIMDYVAVCDRIASVKIMIAQAELMLPKTLIDEIVENNINRLKNKLENKK